MRKVTISLMAVVLLALFVSWSSFAGETKKAKHDYIGAKKCKMCHKKDGVFPSWAETSHAKAWDKLTPEQQKDKEIIKYYTTGTTAKGDLLTGVQCEACHGPGSNYKKKAIMEDQEKAIANGLLMPDEKTCLACHNEKAPKALAELSKKFDYKKMMAKGVHKMKKTETETETEAKDKK